VKVRARSRSDVSRVTALLALVVLTAFAAGVANLLATRNQLVDEVLNNNLATARVAGQTIRANFAVRLKLVGAVAQSPPLVEKLEARQWSRAVADLQLMREVDATIRRASLLDLAGTVRATTSGDPVLSDAQRIGRDASGCDCFQTALARGGPYLSDTVHTDDGLYLTVSSAVRNGTAQPIGVLVAEVPVSVLGLLISTFDVPNDGSVNVFAADGRQLTNVDRPGEPYASYEVFQQAQTKASGTLKTLVPGKTRKRLVAYQRVDNRDNLGWVVLVEQPASAAASVAALTKRLIGFGAYINLILIAGAVLARRLFRQLEGERVRSSSILDSVPDGAVTTDVAGMVTSVNPAMQRLAGWPAEDVVGKPFPDVYQLVVHGDQPVDWRAEFLDMVVSSRTVATTHGYDVGLVTRDGRTVPVSHMLAPILGRGGVLSGCVAVVRDVAYEKELDQMKSSLISTVSHELRTPLTMIQGFSELLLTRSMAPEREREALSRINASSERLARLIDDLLSVSRIESGRLVARTAPLDLGEVAREVAALFAEKRQVDVSAIRDLPLVLADRDMVVQILTNLVSNAVKYSPEGAPVSVAIGWAADTVVATVEDRGIGLSKEELSKLFQKFARADRKEVREVGGTGLGLYITKSLVEMQGGRVWAESEPGRGSRFSFSLPVVKARSGSGSSAPAASTGSDGASRIAVQPGGDRVERPPAGRQRRDE
jgi:PAS domain S-box-containing protein